MGEVAGQATEWREKAKELLKDHFILLDPMRRNFKDNEVDSANEIVEFDLQDIRDADIVLVNYSKPVLARRWKCFMLHLPREICDCVFPFPFAE